MTGLLLFLFIGLLVIDTDLVLQKKQEVKTVLELSNHHATFALIQELKTEGIIELDQQVAMSRFHQRMQQLGAYIKEPNKSIWLPSNSSITSDPISFQSYYVDFQNWQKDVHLVFRSGDSETRLEQVTTGTVHQVTGGYLRVEVYDHKGRLITLAPKKLVGPSLVVIGYVKEKPFVPLLPAHAFPVLSVEELKW